MFFRSLSSWANTEELSGLIYFAQILEELLFDYSLDTYKPSAMTTQGLCKEALRLIQDIDNELIDQTNLSHVLEELCENLSKDEVARSLIDLDLNRIQANLQMERVALADRRTVLEILYGQIDDSLYKLRNEQLLVQAVQDPKGKNRIRSLARSYVSTLLSIGFSERFIYSSNRKFFHWTGYRKQVPGDIERFFDFFDTEGTDYVAIYRGSALFLKIADSCTAFSLEVSETPPEDYAELLDRKNFELNESEAYITVGPTKAMDVFAARNRTARNLKWIRSLSGLFHHKELPSWQSRAVLINIDKDTARIVDESPNSMLMCKDRKPDPAAKKLSKFISSFSLRDYRSFERFDAAAELHAQALRGGTPDNQLVSLWVALETLVPSRIGRPKAKVNNIIDSVLPFLQLDYIGTLTHRLTKDFMNWNRSRFEECLDEVQGKSLREKLLRTLLLEEHEEQRTRLYESLGDFLLLRHRAYYFSQCLSSTDRIMRLLDGHWKRVAWQVRRVYRVRNQIVHAGYSPPYLGVLIRNVHDYLDIVISKVGDLASDGQKINSLDQAFRYVELRYDEFYKAVGGVKEPISSENFDRLIMGS